MLDKEGADRIEAKIDKHTLLLMDIKVSHVKELSLLKLAHQRLKYTVGILSMLFIMKVSIDAPKLVAFIKALM